MKNPIQNTASGSIGNINEFNNQKTILIKAVRHIAKGSKLFLFTMWSYNNHWLIFNIKHSKNISYS
jgi:hypothetical protein